MKNLGIKYPLPDEDDEEIAVCPTMPSRYNKKSPDYGKPSVSLELPEGTELPDSGVIKLRYHTSRKTEDIADGECRYELVIDELVSADPAAGEVDSAGDALETYSRNR